MSLLTRAILAFFIMPFWVAGVFPYLMWREGPSTGFGIGWAFFAVGLFVLLTCAWAFYRNGKGTLAPWRPPQKLVTNGFYRFSRNPMYIGVLLMLLGWAIDGGKWQLFLYFAGIAVLFHLRVVYYEEPWQSRTFGEQWVQYKRAVRRWGFF